MGIPCLCYQPGNSNTFHLYHVETPYPFQWWVTLLLWLFDTIPMPLVACKLKSNSNRSSELLAMGLYLSHKPCSSTAGVTRKASTKQALKSSFLQCICKNYHNHKDQSFPFSCPYVCTVWNRVLKCDVIKMKFLKLWDLSGYSERTMSKRPTCQKWAFWGKLSLRS